MALCSKILQRRGEAEERVSLQCVYGSLVLRTKVEGLDVRAEVIDVPTGESEGFVCPEDCSVIHLLGSVLLDQRTSFAQHGSIVKARGDSELDSELDGMEQITLIIAFPRYIYCTCTY